MWFSVDKTRDMWAKGPELVPRARRGGKRKLALRKLDSHVKILSKTFGILLIIFLAKSIFIMSYKIRKIIVQNAV